MGRWCRIVRWRRRPRRGRSRGGRPSALSSLGAPMAEAVTDRSDKAKRPTRAASADSLRLPTLDLEAVDASKLAQICADENQAARERLTGDQDIVGADRRADLRQCGSAEFSLTATTTSASKFPGNSIHLMETSSVATRNSFGNLIACERPDQKTFALFTMPPWYVRKDVSRARLLHSGGDHETVAGRRIARSKFRFFAWDVYCSAASIRVSPCRLIASTPPPSGN